MGFLNGLLKLGKGAATKSKKLASKAFIKNASPKLTEKLSFVDKGFQKASGIAKEAADGTMQYKTLTKGGLMAVAAVPMGLSTIKTLSGSSTQSSRGMVSVADNMERFISYDGSGFVNNVNDVANGDPEILSDIVNHTFSSQRGVFNDNSLNDIVFALHANREG
jgi:hypothetical protein